MYPAIIYGPRQIEYDNCQPKGLMMKKISCPFSGSRSPPLPGIPTSVNGSVGGNGNNDPLSALEMTRLALWKMYNANPAMAAAAAAATSAPTSTTGPPTTSGIDHLKLTPPPGMPPVSLPSLPSLPSELFGGPDKAQLSLRQLAEKHRKSSTDGDNDEEDKENARTRLEPTDGDSKDAEDVDDATRRKRNGDRSTSSSPQPPAKRALLKNNGHDDEVDEPKDISGLLPGANIKITSRGNFRCQYLSRGIFS